MQLCASNSASTGETLYSPLKISCVNGPLVYYTITPNFGEDVFRGGVLDPFHKLRDTLNQAGRYVTIQRTILEFKRLAFTEVVVDSAPVDEDSLNSIATTEVPF